MAWMPGCATQQRRLPAELQGSAPARLRSHTLLIRPHSSHGPKHGLPGRARPAALLNPSLRLAEYAC